MKPDLYPFLETRPMRRIVPWAALHRWLVFAYLTALGLVLAVPGCGGSLRRARESIGTIEKFVPVAVGTLERYDREHQLSIAREGVASGDPDRARAELEAYRARRGKVVQVITELQALVATGPALLDLVERGQKAQGDVDKYLLALFEFMQRVRETLRELGVPT